MRVRVLYHDHCFDGAASAAFFSRFQRGAFHPGAEFAYSRGASGVLDLLDARRSLKSVELDEVQLRDDAAKAWARREAALEALAPGRP